MILRWCRLIVFLALPCMFRHVMARPASEDVAEEEEVATKAEQEPEWNKYVSRR